VNIIIIFLTRKIEKKITQKIIIKSLFILILLTSIKLEIIATSAKDSGFNKKVTNGIAAAIPIISNIACTIEKNTIIKKKPF
jgi:hypothetical protein